VGAEQGEHRGQVRLLRSMIEDRFSPVPAWVYERLNAAHGDEREAIGHRILRASSVDELFDSQPN